MPNWRLRFRDDFTGHADQAAFEAAYDPSLFGDPGVYHVDWGATNSPDGGPGALAVNIPGHFELEDLARNATGHIGKTLFSLLEGREYKVVARLDNSLDFVRISTQWIDEPSFGNDAVGSPFWIVYSGKAHGGMAYGDMAVQRINNGGPSTTTTNYAGGFPVDTPTTITVEFKLSTGTDGYLLVTRDATIVHSVTGIELWDSPDDLETHPFNYLEISPGGKIGLIEVYDTYADAPDPDPGELTGSTPEPCCGGGGASATGPILPPTVSSWEGVCDGGGTVPTASDLSDAENWDD